MFPLNSERVLQTVQAPPAEALRKKRVPTTAVSVEALRAEVEKLVATTDDNFKLCLQKFASAAAKALATREIVLEENRSFLV